MVDGTHLTPIPIEEESQSLSAILLDEHYYRLIIEGREIVDQLVILKESYILVLKAKAWLDLMRLRDSGVRIRKTDIEKHKRDVFRIYRILDPDQKVVIPEDVKKDLAMFMDEVKRTGVDLKSLGLAGATIDDIFKQIIIMYGLD